MRDATLAHLRGDVYGDISLGEKGGTLSYTAYAGRRQDSPYSGYAYLIGHSFNRMGGLLYGADLRSRNWVSELPIDGLSEGLGLKTSRSRRLRDLGMREYYKHALTDPVQHVRRMDCSSSMFLRKFPACGRSVSLPSSITTSEEAQPSISLPMP